MSQITGNPTVWYTVFHANNKEMPNLHITGPQVTMLRITFPWQNIMIVYQFHQDGCQILHHKTSCD